MPFANSAAAIKARNYQKKQELKNSFVRNNVTQEREYYKANMNKNDLVKLSRQMI